MTAILLRIYDLFIYKHHRCERWHSTVYVLKVQDATMSSKRPDDAFDDV